MREMFDAIGVGHVSVDYLGIIPRYPGLDERMRIMELQRQGGGEVATALVTLARLGASVSFVGKVGDDELGSFTLCEFAKEGVDTSHIVVERGSSSILAFCLVEKESGKRTIFWYKELNPFTEKDLDKDFLLSGRILHLDHHEPEVAIMAASLFKPSGKTIVLDVDSLDPGVEELLRLVDVAIGSENLARFFNEKDYFDAARKIAQYGPKIVVLTLGDKGCLCYGDNQSFIDPGFKVKVVDTTGCGDVFHGAFIYGLLQGWNLRKIARFSNAVAAIKCTKLGGRAGIPTRKEAEDFLTGGS